MGEDDTPKKILITCDGLEADITRLVENIPIIRIDNHPDLLNEDLAKKERDYNRLFDKCMRTTKQLDVATMERDAAMNDCRVLLERLCYYIVRPPRWRIFAYLAWKKSSPGRMADQYKRLADDKHVRQCGEKEIRKIFAKYGYSEELLQK